MTLNVISNFAANVALRNLTFNAEFATRSVSKLSSGSRVVTAADDAASLAIGTRLQTEVLSLGQAQVNAGQATSLLQIVDGSLARVQDILTRGKQLTVQAGSKNLGDTERALLDVEYQNLLEEIDRIAADTEFNGAKLINRGNEISTLSITGLAREFTDQATNLGVLNVTARNFRTKERTDGGDGSFAVSFSASSDTNSNVIFSALAQAQQGSVAFRATINSELIFDAGDTLTGSLVTGTTLVLAQLPVSTTDAAPVVGRDIQGAGYTFLTEFTQDNAELVISLDENFNVATIFQNSATGTANVNLTQGQFNLDTSTTGPAEEFSFKVGTGIIPSQDAVDIEIGGVGVENLGLSQSNLRTFSSADSASQALDQALEFVVERRADVGAGTNRLEAATRNIATIVENSEAARSRLLDLDVASEITTFTNKQILVQAGISTLAQANQLPQNLLRLFA